MTLIGYTADVYDEDAALSVRDDLREGVVMVKLLHMDGTSIRVNFNREVFWRYVKPAGSKWVAE